MNAIAYPRSAAHAWEQAEPLRNDPAGVRPASATVAEALVDERVFGPEAARELRADDGRALAIVSWILVSIVTMGCLLMLGSVAVAVVTRF